MPHRAHNMALAAAWWFGVQHADDLLELHPYMAEKVRPPLRLALETAPPAPPPAGTSKQRRCHSAFTLLRAQIMAVRAKLDYHGGKAIPACNLELLSLCERLRASHAMGDAPC